MNIVDHSCVKSIVQEEIFGQMEDTAIKSLFADVYHRFMTMGKTDLKDDHQSSLNHFFGQPDDYKNTLEFNKGGYDVVCRTSSELICYHHHGLMKSRSIERKSIKPV